VLVVQYIYFSALQHRQARAKALRASLRHRHHHLRQPHRHQVCWRSL
jgi:hypothetical protein